MIHGKMHLNWRTLTPAGLLIVVMLGTFVVTPAFATFCQLNNLLYNYPEVVSSGQIVTTTVTVSGVCAPDDADFYSIRSDLNDMSGLVISDVSVPIGYSQGQNWTITVQNQATAPLRSGSWQILLAVYIFAAIGSGSTIDSVSYKPVTIQVGTSQATQTIESTSITMIQNQASNIISTETAISSVFPTQLIEPAQSSNEAYRWFAAVLVLLLLVMVVIVIRQKKSSRKK